MGGLYLLCRSMLITKAQYKQMGMALYLRTLHYCIRGKSGNEMFNISRMRLVIFWSPLRILCRKLNWKWTWKWGKQNFMASAYCHFKNNASGGRRAQFHSVAHGIWHQVKYTGLGRSPGPHRNWMIRCHNKISPLRYDVDIDGSQPSQWWV